MNILLLIHKLLVQPIFFLTPLLKEFHSHLREERIGKHVLLLLHNILYFRLVFIIFGRDVVSRAVSYNGSVPYTFFAHLFVDRRRQASVFPASRPLDSFVTIL